jgi:hypothetical protein
LEKDNETVPGASIRLWVAILLTIVALWFVDFLLKPVAHQQGTKRTRKIAPMGYRRRAAAAISAHTTGAQPLPQFHLKQVAAPARDRDSSS